jgi:hypothetical protein
MVGVAILAYSLLILSVGRLEAVTFTMAVFYGLVLTTGWQWDGSVTAASAPLPLYGAMMLTSGMVTETLAFTAELGSIRAGRDVYLFSRRFVPDLLIALPQYAAIAAVWSWFFRRYHLTPARQGWALFFFWALTMDQFSHVPALLAGNVVNFVNAGLLMVATFNWPLVVLAPGMDARLPGRRGGVVALTVAAVIQFVPLLVSVAVYGILIGMEPWYRGSR